MSFRFRRTSVRLAVGLVAAAVPLVASSVAQAAMAGANPITTTDRPDLVSATINDSSTATFCFDKPITSVADVGGFSLGGYRADVTTQSLTATASGNCVDANISTSPWFTFAQVGEGAVRTTGNFGNRADSVALSGSNTGNGTRGLTVAPDLQGVSIVSGAPQEIAFTYDEAVDPSAIVGAGGFHFVTSGGQPSCPSTVPACDIASNTATISATDPNTVIAQFPVGGVPIVTSAVRAYSLPGAVTSGTDEVPGGYDSAPAPGSAGVVTGVPTLVSAQYSRQPGVAAGALFAGSPACGTVGANDCVVVDFTFNEGVSVNQGSIGNFLAQLSDGTSVTAAILTEPSGCGGATVANPPCTNGPAPLGAFYGSNTVRAFLNGAGGFPNASPFDDYLVKAMVNGGQTTNDLTLRTALTPLVPPPVPMAVGGCVAPVNTANCAVVSTTTGHPNNVGSAPIGGNTGGKGAGYSTAPDALLTSFDTLTNTAAVTFDSRVWSVIPPGNVSPANYQLLGADGSEIAGATAISTCSPSTSGFPCPLPSFATPGGPGPMTVWVVFPSPAVQVGNAKGLELRGQIGGTSAFGWSAVGGDIWTQPFPNVGPAGNLQDILAPAAVATANKHFRATNHWSHKRMTARFLRAELAKMKHHRRHRR